MRLQGVRGSGREPAVRRALDTRIRLRRRAAPARQGHGLSHRRGPRELGRSGGEQGRRAAAWARDALADPPGTGQGQAEALVTFARRIQDIEPFLAVEVVLSDPYYACYPNFIRYAEGQPVYVGVTEEDGFQYRPDAIQSRIGPRTRAIVINSPANPTGTVLSPERMAAIGELSRGNGPLIVSDEIYHGLSYEGRDRTILEFTDRAFVLNGFSKAYAMTGWRLGWVIAPRDHIRALQTLYGNFFISTNEFVQWAGLAALREAGEDSRRFRAIFDERRRAMIAGLRSIGFGVGAEPTGAFYVLANARHLSTDSVSLARELLESSHVAVTPGAAFGANAEGYLRFSYASSLERIEEGFGRLRRFLATRR